MGADQIAAADLVGTGLDDGNAVRIEVAYDEFAAVRFERQVHRSFSDIERGQQFSALQIDRRHLCRSRAGDERLAAVREDGDVLRLMADWGSTAHRKMAGINQRNRIAAAITDYNRVAIGRNSGQPRRISHSHRRDHLALFQINHRNVGGPGVGHVSTPPVGRNVDEIWLAMNANGRDDGVLFGINHAHVGGAAVDHVKFVLLIVGGDPGGVQANPHRPNWPEGTQINYGNCVALAVGYVGILTICRVKVCKLLLVKVPPAKPYRHGQSDYDEEKFFQAAKRRTRKSIRD